MRSGSKKKKRKKTAAKKPAPSASLNIEEMEVKLLMLARYPDQLAAVISYLYRRKWPTFATASINAAVKHIVKERPDFVLISVNHTNPKVAELPSLLTQTFNINCILFTEDNDRKAVAQLETVQARYKIYGRVSGPNIQRKVQQILREIHGISSESKEEKIPWYARMQAREKKQNLMRFKNDSETNDYLEVHSSASKSKPPTSEPDESVKQTSEAKNKKTFWWEKADPFEEESHQQEEEAFWQSVSSLSDAEDEAQNQTATANHDQPPEEEPAQQVLHHRTEDDEDVDQQSSSGPTFPLNEKEELTIFSRDMEAKQEHNQQSGQGAETDSSMLTQEREADGDRGMFVDHGDPNKGPMVHQKGEASHGPIHHHKGEADQNPIHHQKGEGTQSAVHHLEGQTSSAENEFSSEETDGSQPILIEQNKRAAKNIVEQGTADTEGGYTLGEATDKDHQPLHHQNKGADNFSQMSEGENKKLGKVLGDSGADSDYTDRSDPASPTESVSSKLEEVIKELQPLYSAIQNAVDSICENVGEAAPRAHTTSYEFAVFPVTGARTGYLVVYHSLGPKSTAALINRLQPALLQMIIDEEQDIQVQPGVRITCNKMHMSQWLKQNGAFIHVQMDRGGEVKAVFLEANSPLPQMEETETGVKAVVHASDIDSGTPLDFSAYLYLPKNQRYLKYLKEGRHLLEEQKNRLLAQEVEFYIDADQLPKFIAHYVQKSINTMYDNAPKKKAS